jgi:hypothetical protein
VAQTGVAWDDNTAFGPLLLVWFVPSGAMVSTSDPHIGWYDTGKTGSEKCDFSFMHHHGVEGRGVQ